MVADNFAQLQKISEMRDKFARFVVRFKIENAICSELIYYFLIYFGIVPPVHIYC